MNVEKVLEKAGGVRAVSDHLGVSHQAIYLWVRNGYIPLTRVRALAEMAGIKPEVVAKREIP